MEDYGDTLDDAGKDYLDRVRSNTQYMGRLIDDLLDLSRITRAKFDHRRINLSDLVQSCIERLKESSPDRNVTVTIAKNVEAMCDNILVSAALENLLNNAWKYTCKVSHAQIEFGSYSRNGESIYYVKDNGVGFEMQYYDKLFAVFQRLHKDKEFEGTGIGLATVQRIFVRHGGRIWAESVLNNGTTFYFTLAAPKQENCESAIFSKVEQQTLTI